MNYAVIYSSRTGNTEKLAAALKELLPEEQCVYYGKPNPSSISDAQVIFVGFWTDRGTCDEETSVFLQQLKNKKLFVFGTAGFGGDPQYFDTILNNVLGQIPSSNTILDTYMCQGSMPQAIGNRYQKMLETSPDDAKTKAMLENYQHALSHPDQQDLEQLKEKAILALHKEI